MTNTTDTPTSRTFRIHEVYRATPCGEFAGSDCVRTETLTLLADHVIRTVGRVVGTHEGARIDQRYETDSFEECRGPKGFARACAYRLKSGYSEVTK
jgi:hypothetical protein